MRHGLYFPTAVGIAVATLGLSLPTQAHPQPPRPPSQRPRQALIAGVVAQTPVPVASSVPTDPGALPPIGDPTAPPVPADVTPTTAPAPATVRYLEATGRGFGHGRGLGQYGSYGYAVDLQWPASRILDHYYGGTQSGRLPGNVQRVRLQGFDNKAVTITQPKGQLYFSIVGQTPQPATAPVAAGTPAPTATGGGTGSGDGGALLPVPVAAPSNGSVLPQPGDTTPTVPSTSAPGATTAAAVIAIKVQQIAPNRYQLSDGPGCDGPFTPRIVLDGPGVQFTSDPTGGSFDAARDHDPSDMIQVCVGSTRRPYRGDLVATTDGSSQRLVNHVSMEHYLRSVVPSESPPRWADKPNGIEALKAQAVAARSYAAAEKRSGPANTCDSTACQVYRGRGEFKGTTFTSFEDTRTDRAIAETATEIRVWPNGTTVRTEFSSSTGGWTAPGEFPVVADEGDGTIANPFRRWIVRISAERLEAGRNLGAFVAAEVIRRDGTGPDGGRARRVRLTFTNGSVEIPSTDLTARFGFRSSYYTLAVLERPAGTPLPAGDVFQPTEPGLVATPTGASAGAPAPDPGVVLAGTPETLAPSVQAVATATTVAAPAPTTTVAPTSTTKPKKKKSSTTTTVPGASGSTTTVPGKEPGKKPSAKKPKTTTTTTTTAAKKKAAATKKKAVTKKTVAVPDTTAAPARANSGVVAAKAAPQQNVS
jgi:hypothetical protein